MSAVHQVGAAYRFGCDVDGTTTVQSQLCGYPNDKL
jgi:hypothetical protein